MMMTTVGQLLWQHNNPSPAISSRVARRFGGKLTSTVVQTTVPDTGGRIKSSGNSSACMPLYGLLGLGVVGSAAVKGSSGVKNWTVLGVGAWQLPVFLLSRNSQRTVPQKTDIPIQFSTSLPRGVITNQLRPAQC